jgi:hypothetical protein
MNEKKMIETKFKDIVSSGIEALNTFEHNPEDAEK